MTDIAQLALRDRICDATDRIPTAAWPFYSESIRATIAEGDTSAVLTFEAERDTLITDLSVTAQNSANATLAAQLDVEYCNVVYADGTDVAEFALCCSRKPIFLVGVRENKKLRFGVTLAAAAPAGDAFVVVTISGYQGLGCCG